MIRVTVETTHETSEIFTQTHNWTVRKSEETYLFARIEIFLNLGKIFYNWEKIEQNCRGDLKISPRNIQISEKQLLDSGKSGRNFVKFDIFLVEFGQNLRKFYTKLHPKGTFSKFSKN